VRSSIVCFLVFGAAIGYSLITTASGKVNNDVDVTYDPATFVRVSGSIQEVREVMEPPALKGIHVTLAAEKGPVEVYIAPTGFLKVFSITLARGDQVRISGSKVRFHGSDLVLARELRRDNDVLLLRDEKGNPYWEDEVLKHCGMVPSGTL